MADKSEADIVWGFPGGVKRSDPDYYAVEVMNTILGGGTGLNSRLADVVRDQQGLAYSIFSFYQDGPFAGPFSVGLGTNPANARKALASVAATVKRFKEQGVTQREVDEAVAYLTGSLPVGLETNEGVAGFLWEAEFYHLGADYLDRYAGYYRAVTVAAANSAAKKHLHPESASSVIAGTVPER